ncbi:hypothetical protein ACFV3R_18440 [Streptomyces sp. NPDC059740]|uniref:hypothetical protein n=1 Tax=Streptomyces sp. NPDC059740 TaxID=3346926 RepID=UPI003649BA36
MSPDPEKAATAGDQSRSEEPKTETTLTTRIKINIPGSRPIPPVVVRTPVTDDAPRPEAQAEEVPEAEPLPSRTGATPRPEAPAAAAEEKREPERASDWFAPRKPRGGQSAPGASGPAQQPPAQRTGPGPAGDPGRPDRSGPGAPGARGGADPFATGQAADPFATGQTPSPFDEPAPATPFDTPAASPFDGPATPPGSPFDSPAPAADADPYGAHGSPYGTPPAGTRPPRPAGPTTGPGLGSGSLDLPPGFAGAPAGPGRTDREDPAATGGHPVAADDTAVLTPQPPAPDHGTPPGIAGGVPRGGAPRGAGDTAPGGIPRVSANDKPAPSPFDGSPFDAGPVVPAEDEGPRKSLPPIPEPINPPKKKGRNKLVLLATAVVVVAGVAYGAGLLLDHADIPNGTTALGVDIGGMNREDAVDKLDKALGDRPTAPLTLDVDGKSVSLQPSKAGLRIDTDATVEHASGRDYNPVSVIGSLFGQTHAADPAVVVDDEKLTAALRTATGPANAAEAGGITFEHGRAVPHYGQTYRAVDASASGKAVAAAYEQRAVDGRNVPVHLKATEQQPAVTKAAIDKAMKTFAEPAMSGMVTVRTDAVHSISFSPEKSIPKFLSMTVVSGGQLQPHYDLKALHALYGATFDGETVETASGPKPVTPELVSVALNQALRSTDPAGRTQVLGDAG